MPVGSYTRVSRETPWCRVQSWGSIPGSNGLASGQRVGKPRAIALLWYRQWWPHWRLKPRNSPISVFQGTKSCHSPFLDFLLEARNVLNLLIVQHATCSNTRFWNFQWDRAKHRGWAAWSWRFEPMNFRKMSKVCCHCCPSEKAPIAVMYGKASNFILGTQCVANQASVRTCQNRTYQWHLTKPDFSWGRGGGLSTNNRPEAH